MRARVRGGRSRDPGRFAIRLVLLLAAGFLAPAPTASATLRAQGGRPESPRPAAALAQYIIRTWTEEHGLPQNSVTCILQTRDGYLWLGTFLGLVRFDGVRFTVFDRTVIPAMHTNYVTSLLEDPAGGLWAGTDGGGVLHFRDDTVSALTKREGLPSDHVRALAAARGGGLWVGTTEHGIARISSDRRVRAHGRSDGLADDFVLALTEDAEGVLWVGTRKGLSELRGGRWRTHTVRDGLSHNHVTSVIPAADGGLWIGTSGGGVNRLVGGRLTAYGTKDGLTSPVIYTLFEDSRQRLWIGTNGGGLNRLSKGASTLSTRRTVSRAIWCGRSSRTGKGASGSA